MKASKGKYRMMAMAAAVSIGLAAGAGSAMAQQRVGSDGHALDASNRIGSGGYNTAPSGGTRVTPNDIVYGNVTGGRGFSGTVNSTDPRAFRGQTAGTQMDRFVSGSSGAPASYAPAANPYTPQPFFGSSRGVAPPPGYVQEGSTGGFISADVTPHRMRGDTRAGQVYLGIENYHLPQPGEMTLLGGNTGSEGGGVLVTGSPLYGIRQWNSENPSDRAFLQNFTNIGQEIQWNAQRQAAAQATGANVEIGRLLPPQQPANPRPEPMGRPLGTPGQSDAAANASGNQPLENRVGNVAQQGYETLNAKEQSPQYQQMHQRLEAFYKGQHLSDEQARRMADQQMQLRIQAQQGKQPSGPATPGKAAENPAAGVPGYQQRMHDILKQSPDQDQTPRQSSQASAPVLPAPIEVESLGEGIESPGLSQHMKRAETLMQEGKFASAIDQYKAAQKISPHNALVLLGRANAELGAGYFNPAATHLRMAYLSDPTISMGRFDLKKMIGRDRLTEVATDLKTIANKDLKSPAPVFLLAYIAYNTGSPDMAAQWLDAALRRADDNDPLFKLLQTHWSLNHPATRPASRPAPASTPSK